MHGCVLYCQAGVLACLLTPLILAPTTFACLSMILAARLASTLAAWSASCCRLHVVMLLWACCR